MNNPVINLYHYTTLNTLALILKNRCIRFNNLSDVDDLLEGETIDFGNVGHTLLVSCWSKAPVENIALWKMYGGDFSGCIIKLPSNMFKNHKMGNYKCIYRTDKAKEEKIKELFHNSSIELKTTLLDLIQVKYNNRDKKYLTIKKDGSKKIDDISVVKYKKPEWAFQKEWRFVIEQFLIHYNLNKVQDKDQYLPFYDLEVDEKAFQKMEIILGPFANESDIAIVDSLINTYNPSCRYTKSKIKVRNKTS